MVRHTIAVAAVLAALGACTARAQDVSAEPETPDAGEGTADEQAVAEEAPPQATTEWDEEQRAQQAFLEGRAAFEAGDFARAIELFEQAYEGSPRPELMYDIGTAYDRLRDDENALQSFELFLRTSPPSSPHRPEVESRIQVLREQIERQRALEAPPPPPPEPTVFERWWFWGIVGAVLVGGTVTAILIATAEADVQTPLPGDDGVVVETLRVTSW